MNLGFENYITVNSSSGLHQALLLKIPLSLASLSESLFPCKRVCRGDMARESGTHKGLDTHHVSVVPTLRAAKAGSCRGIEGR